MTISSRTITAAVAATLLLAAPASAAPAKQIIPYEFTVGCDGFDIEVSGVETLFTQRFDDRVVEHDSFRETDTNTVSGLTVRFMGNKTDSHYYDGHRVVTNQMHMIIPGEGGVIHDV